MCDYFYIVQFKLPFFDFVTIFLSINIHIIFTLQIIFERFYRNLRHFFFSFVYSYLFTVFSCIGHSRINILQDLERLVRYLSSFHQRRHIPLLSELSPYSLLNSHTRFWTNSITKIPIHLTSFGLLGVLNLST